MSEERKLFSGLVCVQVWRDAVTMEQFNEQWIGEAASEDAARGEWIRKAVEKHPNGVVAYSHVYDVTDLALAFAQSASTRP